MDESTGSPAGEVTNESIYWILGDRRRRYIIHYLKQRDGETTVRDLTEQVAAWENRKEKADVSSQERKRVYVSLYQSHLPTLDEQGFIHYDESEGTVKLAAPLRETRITFEVVESMNIPWGEYYLGLVLVSGLVVGLGWFDIYPISLLSGYGIAGVILAAFAVSASVHTYQTRQHYLGDDIQPFGAHDIAETDD